MPLGGLHTYIHNVSLVASVLVLQRRLTRKGCDGCLVMCRKKRKSRGCRSQRSGESALEACPKFLCWRMILRQLEPCKLACRCMYHAAMSANCSTYSDFSMIAPTCSTQSSMLSEYCDFVIAR